MSGSGASTPTSGAPLQTDIYRPLAAQVQRAIAPLLADAPAPAPAPGAADSGGAELPSLLGVDAKTYSARLSGKTVLLTDIPSSGPSALVQGRKRSRGDMASRAAARAEQAARERRIADTGVDGIRKSRSRIPCTSNSERVDYAALLPLHYLHVRYMIQLLGLPPLDPAAGAPATPATPAAAAFLPGISPEAVQAKLVKADLTGARLRVCAAHNASLVGVEGLVLEETKGSIRLVGRDSRIRVVPKQSSQFTLAFPAYAPAPPAPAPGAGGPAPEPDMAAHIAACPQLEVDILGTAFAYRSGDRAGRKFRPMQAGGGGSGWAEHWVSGEWSDLLREPAQRSPLPARASDGRRKRGKSRRKDPLAQGSIQVF